MKNLMRLIKGEVVRLAKYKILMIALVVSLMWVAIVILVDRNDVEPIIPLLILMDAGMMSIIFLAASFYLEKQEGSIKSLLVAPIRLADILISKVVAAVVLSFVSTGLIILAGYIVHGIAPSLLLLVLFASIIVLSHTAIGFVITLNSKDFGGMIGQYALYALIALVPSVLRMVGIIPESMELLLIISPFYAGQLLISSLFFDVELLRVILALGYLIALGVLLYGLVVYKKFKNYAIGG